jgi:RHS repeat-associated protein
MTYDNRGRLTVSTLKGVTGDPADLTTNYLFDDAGRLTKVTLPLGNGSSYVYDGSNRLTDTIRFAANGNQQERVHLTLNVMSEKMSEEAQRCNTPAPSCAAWTTHRSEGFHYDGFGRLDQVNHPDATTAFFTYDAAGNLHDVRDENHSSPNTTYGYDLANRLTSVTQTLLGAPGNQILTSYGYDVQDNLSSVTDPKANATTYLFDDFRRMRRQVSPVTGTTDYAHDPAGNLLTLTDANAATTTRTYDAANRVLTAVSTRSGLATESVTFTYDDPTAGNFGRGRLSSMTDPTGSTTYAYERRGLLRLEPHTVEGNPYSLSYAYDGNGNRRQVTYPGGLAPNYTFDYADRPLSAPGWVTSATYKPFGPLEQIHYVNGTTKTMTYNTRYQPTGNKLEKDAPLTTLANYGLIPDPVGNIDQINDLMTPTYNRTFDYDDLNRLTTTNSGTSMWGAGSHAYDTMGNITTITLGTARTASFTYVGTTPKINTATDSGIGTRNVTYDGAGNETGVGTGTFSYSPRNYLASGEGLAYSYDGRGVRTITVNNTGVLAANKPKRYHFYSPELNLLSETFLATASVPIIQTEYVWFAGQPVGQIEYAFVNKLWWTFTDHLGTPFIRTDSSGGITWRAEYEPYGRVFALRTPNRYQPLRLPGQEAQETNILSTDGNGASERYYNVFRWYRNRWGRYSQPDPVWRGDGDMGIQPQGRGPSMLPAGHLTQRLDTYAYVLANPLSFLDPLGLSAASPLTCHDNCPPDVKGAADNLCRNRNRIPDPVVRDCVANQCTLRLPIRCDHAACPTGSPGQTSRGGTFIIICPGNSGPGQPSPCYERTMVHELLHVCFPFSRVPRRRPGQGQDPHSWIQGMAFSNVNCPF